MDLKKSMYNKKDCIDLSIIVPFYNGNTYMPTLMLCLERNICDLLEYCIEVVLINDSPNEQIKIEKIS